MKDASLKPWSHPELKKSADFTLESLRETRHMIASLQDREKRLKADLQQLFENGDLEEFLDDENDQRIIGPGISATLCTGKSTRQWFPEIQSRITELQEQLDDVKRRGEAARAYTDKPGSPYWRINLEKDEIL